MMTSLPFLSVVLGIPHPSSVFVFALIDNVREGFDFVHEIFTLHRDRALCHLLHEVALGVIQPWREWPPWDNSWPPGQSFKATYHGATRSVDWRAQSILLLHRAHGHASCSACWAKRRWEHPVSLLYPTLIDDWHVKLLRGHCGQSIGRRCSTQLREVELPCSVLELSMMRARNLHRS